MPAGHLPGELLDSEPGTVTWSSPRFLDQLVVDAVALGVSDLFVVADEQRGVDLEALVEAALEGNLENVEYTDDTLFHIKVPKSCPGVPADVLVPKNTWKDKAAYDARAKKLATDFAKAFDKNYGNKGLDKGIVAACPGK